MTCHTCGATPTLYQVGNREWCKAKKCHEAAKEAARATSNQTSHSQDAQDRAKAHRELVHWSKSK